MTNFDSVFWLSLATLFCGSFALIIRYIFKIKCDVFKCCGVEIHRNIEQEIAEQRIIGNIRSTDSHI